MRRGRKRIAAVGKRGREYAIWRQDYLSRHPGPQFCMGVWKKGVKVCDCPRGIVGFVEQGPDGIWRASLDVGHKRGRNTHLGAGAKMTDDGCGSQCRACNRESSGNKMILGGAT